MKIKFSVEGNEGCEIETDAYYKNENKIACIVPEIPDLAQGEYEVSLSFSINGQQWANTDQKILYLAPEEGMNFEDIAKLDSAADKNKK